ncbi:MAG: ATP-binding protein [Pirellulales bacterium]|jgi:CheY-like chemotaxis protein
MPIVLVVDDSPVDRLLIGGLLEKDLGWLIEYAENGAEALARMNDLVPDVLITDMIMPQMDGMELVAAVREEYPQVPVILITGHGSEALAVDALDQGAASYVPKSQLADKLQGTVEQVLALASTGRTYEKLMECFTSTEFTLYLDNDPALIFPLVDFARQMLAGMNLCGAAERMHVGVALEEALFNALCHGSLELPPGEIQQARSELCQGKVSRLVEERRKQSPYRDRRIFVQARVNLDEARFVVRDEGPGFDVAAAPDPRAPNALDGDGSRGVVLMRTFMDEVAFNHGGREVVLVKRRDASEDEIPEEAAHDHRTGR